MGGFRLLLILTKQFAAYGIPALFMVSTVKALYKWIGKGTPTAGEIAKEFLRPVIIGVLIFSFSWWTDFIGGFLYTMPKYLTEEFSETTGATFSNDRGETISPWEKYQDIMSNYRETQLRLYYEQGIELKDDGYIAESAKSTLIWIFDLLMEGIYFIVVLVLEKVQEALLSFIMTVGIFALMLSYIPGYEKSVDKWFSYFLSIQLWSVSTVIIKIFYDASIVNEIQNLEIALAAGSLKSLHGYGHMVNYIANCVSYVLLFISVPFLSTIFIEKRGGW